MKEQGDDGVADVWSADERTIRAEGLAGWKKRKEYWMVMAITEVDEAEPELANTHTHTQKE